MSTSDSELSEASKSPAPPDHELENALRRAVVKAQEDEVDFSYKYIRTAAETNLGLTPGFFKSHAEWNARSKEVVDEQMNAEPEPESSPPKSKPKPKPKPKAPEKKSTKRKSAEREPAPTKRQKTTKQDNEDVSDDLSSPLSDVISDVEEKEPKKKLKKPPKPRTTESKPSKAKKSKPVESDEDKAEEKIADDSESELSVLLDDEPAPKKKRKQTDPKAKTSRTSTKAKADSEDPDQAEIKRLQGWLVKCGIRKLWGKELKPYDTTKAKIKHLRDMLADAGMTGRYSLEKANQIKEARELAADIEAVQEGAERWGAEDEDGVRGEKPSDGGTHPAARRLVRGAKNYDFLSSDGEETD